MRRENAEIIKPGMGIESVIKDYSRLRDWELKILVDKGYEEAMAEQEYRTGCSLTGKTSAVEPK